MSAFMKLTGETGEAKDQNHQGSDGWFNIDSVSSPIYRAIAEGVTGADRFRGATTLGDIVVVRRLDGSSPKLAAASANGTIFDPVQIDLCTDVGGEAKMYMSIELANVIITSYSFHGTAEGDPVPTEEVTLNGETIKWKYQGYNADGTKGSQSEGEYNPAEQK